MTAKKTTKPLGRGTKNVTANVPEKLKTDLEQLARASGLGIGAYMRVTLAKAAENGTIYRMVTEEVKKVRDP